MSRENGGEILVYSGTKSSISIKEHSCRIIKFYRVVSDGRRFITYYEISYRRKDEWWCTETKTRSFC